MQMDIELDDTAARVQSVLERGLLPASLANHTGEGGRREGGLIRVLPCTCDLWIEGGCCFEPVSGKSE
jgi:hypothetical protein